MKPRSLLATLAIALMLAPFGTTAATLAFSATDPVGDHLPGTIDVTGMHVVVDPLNGEFVATLFSDALNPFSGSFNVELGLGLASEPVFGFDLTETTTSLTIGPAVEPSLADLASGDEAFAFGNTFDGPTINLATGRTPDGALPVRIRITGGGAPSLLPGFGTFVDIYDEFEPQTSAVSAVPLPAGAWLFLFALGLLGRCVRSRASKAP